MKRNLIVLVVLLIAAAGIWFLYTTSAKISYQAAAPIPVSTSLENQSGQTSQAATPIDITADDVLRAGFVSPKVEPPTADGNYQPATYFWVNLQKGVTALDKQSARNLLAISVVSVPKGYQTLFNYGAFYNSTSTPFAIDGGIGSESLGLAQGRTTINFIKSDRYVVIIGPGAKEVEALARIVAGRIN